MRLEQADGAQLATSLWPVQLESSAERYRVPIPNCPPEGGAHGRSAILRVCGLCGQVNSASARHSRFLMFAVVSLRRRWRSAPSLLSLRADVRTDATASESIAGARQRYERGRTTPRRRVKRRRSCWPSSHPRTKFDACGFGSPQTTAQNAHRKYTTIRVRTTGVTRLPSHRRHTGSGGRSGALRSSTGNVVCGMSGPGKRQHAPACGSKAIGGFRGL
jgi:hypothetical protein